jgi:hypothetical protein
MRNLPFRGGRRDVSALPRARGDHSGRRGAVDLGAGLGARRAMAAGHVGGLAEVGIPAWTSAGRPVALSAGVRVPGPDCAALAGGRVRDLACARRGGWAGSRPGRGRLEPARAAGSGHARRSARPNPLVPAWPGCGAASAGLADPGGGAAGIPARRGLAGHAGIAWARCRPWACGRGRRIFRRARRGGWSGVLRACGSGLPMRGLCRGQARIRDGRCGDGHDRVGWDRDLAVPSMPLSVFLVVRVGGVVLDAGEAAFSGWAGLGRRAPIAPCGVSPSIWGPTPHPDSRRPARGRFVGGWPSIWPRTTARQADSFVPWQGRAGSRWAGRSGRVLRARLEYWTDRVRHGRDHLGTGPDRR